METNPMNKSETAEEAGMKMEFKKTPDEIEANIWKMKAAMNNIAGELGAEHPDVLEIQTTLNNMDESYRKAKREEGKPTLN